MPFAHISTTGMVCVVLCVTDAGSQPFRSRRRLNSKQIMGLDDGEDIYRAMHQVADPLSFQVHMGTFTVPVWSCKGYIIIRITRHTAFASTTGSCFYSGPFCCHSLSIPCPLPHTVHLTAGVSVCNTEDTPDELQGDCGCSEER